MVAVMFTFSFSTAFAATAKTYTATEVEAELETTISSFIAAAETQKANVVGLYAFDTDGYATVNGVKVTEEAIEAAFEAVVDELEEIMDGRKETIVDSLDSTATYDKTTLDGYKTDITDGLTNAASGISSYLNGQPALYEAQAPLTKDAVEEAIDEDYLESDYPATGEFEDTANKVTGKLTAQQVISQVKTEAAKAISDADKTLASELKTAGTDKSAQTSAYKKAIAAYEKAYSDIAKRIKNFKDNGEEVKDNDGVAADEKQDELAAAVKIAELKQYVYGTYYNAALKFKPTDWKNMSAVYTADATGTGVTVFGVHIAKKDAPTNAETKEFQAAMFDAVDKAVEAAEVYYEDGTTSATDLYTAGTGNHGKFSATVNNAYALADKYQDVVDYGTKLKNTKYLGEKKYDDAKVDAVVAAAEAFVYADLDETAATFKNKTAENYIELAAEKVNEKTYAGIAEALKSLENTSTSLLAQFVKAQENAVKKFYSAAGVPQIKISYGSNKTAEEDLVYLKANYADADDWAEIADKAVAAINAAESYADIDAALETAKAELAEITPDDDVTKLANLVKSYQDAIKAYAEQKAALADADVYTVADYSAAALDAQSDIAEAKTLAEAEKLFEEAKDYVDSVVPTADKDAAETAVKAAIKALPLASKVTLEDADEVEAVREQLDAYNAIPGTKKVSDTRLTNAEAKIFELEAEALEEELKAMVKKVKAIGAGTDDKTLEEALAAKAEVEALNAKVEAYNDEVDAYNEAYNKSIAKITGTNAKTVADFEAIIYADEMVVFENAVEMLGNDLEDADPVAVKAAKELFNKLTEKQQFTVEYYADRLATAEKNVEAVTVAAVEGIKITASSKMNGKKITVKWTVDGEEELVDYYEIRRSTQKNKGFGTKPYFTTTKTTYTNSKDIKAGNTYYYKVRAVAEINGVTYTSDWSNKAYRTVK